MNLEPPKELVELELKIKELSDQAAKMRANWYDSVAPFKIGQSVSVKKRKNSVSGVVVWQAYSHGNDWKYGVDVTFKNGKVKRFTVYSWEKITAL